MPCSDYGEAEARADALGLMRDHERFKISTAALCGIMNAIAADPALNRTITQRVDWAAAGITPDDLSRWFDDHRKRDLINLGHGVTPPGLKW